MKLLDLFSGIGGFSLAARWSGIETIQFVEKDEFCKKVLMKNFPNVPIHDDIKTFNFYKDIEILTGGFPCQPFSVAGRKKGFLDDRYLWPEMLRIIKQCRPQFIIAENVPGIVSLLDPIIEDLEKENYTCTAYLIPANFIGAPHKRERVWIIANTNSKRRDDRINIGEKRHLQNDIQRNIKALQSKWAQFIPKPWATFNAEAWLGESPVIGIDDGIPNRVDRNKSLGNSIVPQMAYIFLKSIAML